jgi:serine/threonine protein kinase
MLIKNQYRVMKTLGEGGYGQVYLAEDTRMPPGRQCVIKQMKPVATGPGVYQIVQERFQREAVTLEKLGENNRQVPRLYAYFSENQKFYLVQEWIEGQTLAALVKAKGPQRESVVRTIVMALLPVLDYIHSKGVIHRDIKPENIILRAGLSDVEDQPVLIDFGAVRETMGTRVDSHNSPISSIVIGTPGYMASEQAAGKPIPSSDLYSLGLVAIYLLTGLTPQLLKRDPQTGEIVLPDKVGQASKPLAAVIACSIRSHAHDRYSSANEMLAALNSPYLISPEADHREKVQSPISFRKQLEQAPEELKISAKEFSKAINVSPLTKVAVMKKLDKKILTINDIAYSVGISIESARLCVKSLWNEGYVRPISGNLLKQIWLSFKGAPRLEQPPADDTYLKLTARGYFSLHPGTLAKRKVA